MATEKRLIDANKILYHLSGFPKGDGFDSGLDWAFREDIDKLPTVDAVEVVRCGKCRFWEKCESSLIGEVMCCTGQGNMLIQKAADDFCSYGERRCNNEAD